MNNYLYEKIQTIKDFAGITTEIPDYIIKNLNPNYELRHYQKEAFENFIYYFNNESLREKPTQLLFHMATGSGKTLIMAGLILYLYNQGYRNFLFFVNSTTIIKKTKENFLNNKSSKYLFNEKIIIDSKKVNIKEVSNFQNTSPDDINICFYTVQGLHMDLNFVKENRLSLDDFNDKTVFISDEAHHINTISLNNKLSSEEEELKKSWEYTIDSKLLHSNVENVLIEFTATCDIENENIRNKYLNKMIYSYDLKHFRSDGYSKEVETLQSNVPMKDKMLQAVLLSQYRMKLFQDNKLDIKPVILFKSDLIDNSIKNMNMFIDIIENLTEDDIYKIRDNSSNELIMDMFIYFDNNNIEMNSLISEIKDDFSKNKCISVNNPTEAQDVQLIVNSLEDKDNYYRAIFEVKMLDEGWDVLNLFDIVRLYETRDGKNGKPGKKTIQEAQLIGRGARYCPFTIDRTEEKYTRKFDNDITNPLRICETLLYHCQLEPRYISELKIALKETGIIPEESKKITYKLKDDFKKNDFFREGLVFFNEKVIKDRSNVKSISNDIKNQIFEFSFSSGMTKHESLFEEKLSYKNLDEVLNSYLIKIKEIKNINYNIVLSALRKNNIFSFSVLKRYFPNLKTTREFVESDDYLGNITLNIRSVYKEPTNYMIYSALLDVLEKVKVKLLSFDTVYEGSKEFKSKRFNEIFKDKVINISNPGNDSVGISQALVDNDSYRLDLSDKNWYVYNDNYGTTEEKKFVKFFENYVSQLEEKYDEVFLTRNERTLPIYSFDNGDRFEPDYLLIMIDKNMSNPKQYQIFVEPKGSHLLVEDKWKEDLLLSLSENAIPTTKFVENSEYTIWGFPFFNGDNIDKFKEKFDEIL